MSGDQSPFDKVWAEKTDEQLLDALVHIDQYEPEAIASVKREISRRNLGDQRIVEMEAVAAKESEEESNRAQMPLQWPLRIVMFLLTIGLPQLVIWEYYERRGYTRRSQEIWRCMVYGLLFWLGIYLFIYLLKAMYII